MGRLTNESNCNASHTNESNYNASHVMHITGSSHNASHTNESNHMLMSRVTYECEAVTSHMGKTFETAGAHCVAVCCSVLQCDVTASHSYVT